MIKVVWVPNENDYSYCEFVAQNTPYSIFRKNSRYLTFVDYIGLFHAAAFVAVDFFFRNVFIFPHNNHDNIHHFFKIPPMLIANKILTVGVYYLKNTTSFL